MPDLRKARAVSENLQEVLSPELAQALEQLSRLAERLAQALERAQDQEADRIRQARAVADRLGVVNERLDRIELAVSHGSEGIVARASKALAVLSGRETRPRSAETGPVALPPEEKF